MKKLFSLIIFILLISKNNGQTNGCFYSLTPNTYTISPHGLAHSIANGDFNNDGLLDLAISASNRINIFIGDGNGGFSYGNTFVPTLVATHITNLIALNFDNNANLDLSYSENGSLFFLSGNGLGGFTSNNVSGIGCLNPGTIFADNINNDAHTDIIVGSNCNPAFYSYHGDGNGAVTSATFANGPANGPNVNSVITHDFNLDGLKEIIVTLRNFSSIGVYNGSSTNSYTNFVTYPVIGAPIVIKKGDLNGDGFIDLVSLNTLTVGYSVLLGTSNSTFNAAVTTSLNSTAKSMDVADFDLDGKLDMAVSFDDAVDNIKVYKGNGDGTFSSSAFTLAVGNDPARFAAIDLNNDGKKDIVCANRASNTLQIWMNGNVNINTTPSYSVCNGTNILLNANGANTYTWSFGANGSSVSYPVSSNTLLTVSGTNTISGCSNSASVNILNLPKPTVNISTSNTVICSGETVTLSATGANTYTWNTTSTSSIIAVQPTNSTTYSVIGTNTVNCSSNALISIIVSPCTYNIENLLDEIKIYPNPAKDAIYINSNKFEKYTLVNSLGSIIKRGELNLNSKKITIDDLNPGMYFIILSNSNESKTQRFTISN